MNAASFLDCKWINQPTTWSLNENILNVTTDEKTDFWQDTYYGFKRDTGHFFGKSISGNFMAQLRFQAKYSHLYDQAGMMIRIDETLWIKAGIEYSDNKHALSIVVTVGKSDWSIGTLVGNPEDVHLRVTLNDGSVRIQASCDGVHWPVFRVFSFPHRDNYLVGPMCCSPERSGFDARFSEFTIGPPMSKDLHDLT
jgi:uncharacterized protein